MRQLIVYFFCFVQIPLGSMQKVSETLVKLKHDESCHMLALPVLQKSITMYEKYLWKDWLCIAQGKPIVVEGVSPQQLKDFNDATEQTEKTFPDFYKQLTAVRKQELINAAGQHYLNSPEITTLLAQAYFGTEICGCIIPYMEKEVVKRYLQHKMIAQNMYDSCSTKLIYDNIIIIFLLNYMRYDFYCSVISLFLYYRPSLLFLKTLFFSEKKQLFCTDGPIYGIPADFTPHSYGYTTKLFSYPHEEKYDRDTDDGDLIMHTKKRVGDYEYQIASAVSWVSATEYQVNGYLIRRVKDGHIIKKELSLKGQLLTARCSPDGNYVALCTDYDNTSAILLLTLNHSLDDIIEQEMYLTPNLHQLVDMHFSKDAFFVFSYDPHSHKSQLIVYDLLKKKEKVAIYDEGCDIVPAINHDATRMIVPHATTLSIWDISVLQNPVCLKTIDIEDIGGQIACYCTEKYNFGSINPKVNIIGLSYAHNSNNAVAQLDNGGVVFIDELLSGEISTHFVINRDFLLSYNTLCNPCLLYTPDNNFLLVPACMILHEHQNTDISLFSCMSVWDVQSKQVVVTREFFISSLKKSALMMSSDECSFIVQRMHTLFPSGKNKEQWQSYRLFTADEKAVCDWFSGKLSLFSVYALRRLHQACIHQQELMVTTDDAFDTFVKTVPNNIHRCLAKYLIVKHQKTIVELLLLHWNMHTVASVAL